MLNRTQKKASIFTYKYSVTEVYSLCLDIRELAFYYPGILLYQCVNVQCSQTSVALIPCQLSVDVCFDLHHVSAMDSVAMVGQTCRYFGGNGMDSRFGLACCCFTPQKQHFRHRTPLMWWNIYDVLPNIFSWSGNKFIYKLQNLEITYGVGISWKLVFWNWLFEGNILHTYYWDSDASKERLLQ
jgi:hypothetical protein